MTKRYLWHDYLFEDVVEAQNKPTGRIFKRGPGRALPKWWAHEWSRRMNERQREQREARRKQALTEAVERQKGRRPQYQTRAPHRMVDKVMRLMEPGQWYGLKALCRAAGLDRSRTGRVYQVLRDRAWATRLKNPAWDPEWRSQVKPGAEEVEPEWLWQLTEAGEEEKARVALLGCDSPEPAST